MLYEIRRYVCTPGKRNAVLTRFDTAVLPLFERHGIAIDRFWVDRDDADVEALGLTIDQLGTALTLISTHDRVVVAEAGDTTISGRAAIRRILAEARPVGVSANAWREITRAAADAFALA